MSLRTVACRASEVVKKEWLLIQEFSPIGHGSILEALRWCLFLILPSYISLFVHTVSHTHTPQNLCFKVRVLAFLVVCEAFFLLGFMTILYLESFVSWILFNVCCCILLSLPPCSCWLYYGVWSMAATTFSLFQYISFIEDEKNKIK